MEFSWKRLAVTAAIAAAAAGSVLAAEAMEARTARELEAERVFVEQEPEDAYLVLVDGGREKFRLYDAGGNLVETAAPETQRFTVGPIPPGVYRLVGETGTVEFTLACNAAISEARGDGITDGEILWFGAER